MRREARGRRRDWRGSEQQEGSRLRPPQVEGGKGIGVEGEGSTAGPEAARAAAGDPKDWWTVRQHEQGIAEC